MYYITIYEYNILIKNRNFKKRIRKLDEFICVTIDIFWNSKTEAIFC